jgi:ABC-type lipoprotein release transport system permease subunit
VELFRIGLRNIARNPRRSVLNIAALGLGVAVMIIGLGWIRGYYTTIYSGVKRLETGDLQVLRSGYLDQERRLPLDLAMTDASAAVRQIAADPQVRAVAPRIDFGATVATGAGSVRVLGRAIDPAAERRVTNLAQFIQDGSYLGGASGILIGAPLARKLGATVGHLVALTAVDRNSVENFLEIPVRGIFRFGLPSLDENLVFVDLATARDLLATPDSATRLVIRLNDGVSEPSALASVSAILRGSGSQVYPWRQFAQEIVAATSADIGGFWIVLLVIFALVGVGIVNSMAMAVQERTREIGTLRAIGIRRPQLTMVLMSEAATLAIAAAVIGCILGGAVAFFVQTVGFDFSRTSLEMPIPLGHRFTGDYRAADFLVASAVSLGAAMAGCLFPTRRAARLNIARSLGTRAE